MTQCCTLLINNLVKIIELCVKDPTTAFAVKKLITVACRKKPSRTSSAHNILTFGATNESTSQVDSSKYANTLPYTLFAVGYHGFFRMDNSFHIIHTRDTLWYQAVT